MPCRERDCQPATINQQPTTKRSLLCPTPPLPSPPLARPTFDLGSGPAGIALLRPGNKRCSRLRESELTKGSCCRGGGRPAGNPAEQTRVVCAKGPANPHTRPGSRHEREQASSTAVQQHSSRSIRIAGVPCHPMCECDLARPKKSLPRRGLRIGPAVARLWTRRRGQAIEPPLRGGCTKWVLYYPKLPTYPSPPACQASAHHRTF